MRIKDVAREAGVSTATVSHVINNTKYVSDVTRERVLRAIKSCNYYANAHARTLASGAVTLSACSFQTSPIHSSQSW